MRLFKILALLVGAASASAQAAEPSVQFQSGNQQTQLVELYSSQGCSSCPPAEAWVNRFVKEPGLFESVIPMVFHVDYWDYIGWQDPFGSPRHSMRQRKFKTSGLSMSVYTPEFIVNGQEWRGWFARKSLPSSDNPAPRLSANLTPEQLSVELDTQEQDLVLHLAILGVGLRTYVPRGENARRTLEENFVVLQHQSFRSEQAVNRWQETWYGMQSNHVAERYAAVVWVTKANGLEPLQATATWLPPHFSS